MPIATANSKLIERHRAGQSAPMVDRNDPTAECNIQAGGRVWPVDTHSFETQLHLAVAYAYTQDSGCQILMPPGVWPMTTTLTLPSRFETSKEIVLAGAGQASTLLRWPSTFAGVCISVDGSVGSAGNFYFGELRDFTIAGNTTGVPGLSTGLQLKQCVYTKFKRIQVTACSKGLYLTGSGGNNQDLRFTDIWLSACLHGLWVANTNSTRFDFLLINSNDPTGAEITLDTSLGFCDITIAGGMLQSGGSSQPSITTVNPNAGGIRFKMSDFYHEGARSALLKTYPATGTADYFELERFEAGGYVTLFDVSGTHDLRVGRYFSAPDTTVLKARNCGTITLDCAPDPIDNPSLYDLDAASRSGLVVRDNVYGKIYQGDKSNATSVTALLTPYAAEIWDANIASKRSVSAGKLVSLTGLLNSSSWAAPSAPRRPVFNTSDSVFGGAASFSCVAADTSILAGTLAVPLAAGAYAGLFIVCRWTASSVNGGNRINVSDGTSYGSITNILGIGWNDGSFGTANAIFGSNNIGAGNATFGGVVDGVMTQGYATLLQPTYRKEIAGQQNGLYSNQLSSASYYGASLESPLTVTNSHIYIGQDSSGTVHTGWPSVDITYCAVLKAPLATGEIDQLLQLACAKWNLW